MTQKVPEVSLTAQATTHHTHSPFSLEQTLCQSYPSPNVQHARLVLCLPRPHGDLVPLGSDVDDSPTHLPAVLLEALPDQAQQLGPKREDDETST